MTPNQQEALPQIIKNRRVELGLSASELARRAGVQKSTISRLEAGERQTPKADILMAIARVLGLSNTDLFVAADWMPEGELPSFKPYLRAKYGDLPAEELAKLEATFAKVAKRHGYDGNGPAPGEDET
ncbi:helix-turn-helix transcriptional regulator [Kribbella sp. NPDC026611]|uniref:helix-turn-helix domain-containing protein n=1 Tax=Kribbella sp. NPDC026611 TaxID=3154911 RepID=UPI0033FD5712